MRKLLLAGLIALTATSSFARDVDSEARCGSLMAFSFGFAAADVNTRSSCKSVWKQNWTYEQRITCDSMTFGLCKYVVKNYGGKWK